MTLRHYYDNLVDMLLAIERAERDFPGQGTPPLQVLPPPPATPEEARKEAEIMRKCQRINIIVIILSFMTAISIFALQMTQSSATVLDLGNLWNGIFTTLTVRSCSKRLAISRE